MASVSPRSTSPLLKPVPYNELRATKHPLDMSLSTPSTQNLFRDWADLSTASKKEVSAQAKVDQEQAIQERNQRAFVQQMQHITPENTPAATTLRLGNTDFVITAQGHPQSSRNPRAFQPSSMASRTIDNLRLEDAQLALEAAKAEKKTVRTRLEESAKAYKAMRDPNSSLSAINVARTRLAKIYNTSQGLIPRPASPK